MNSLDILTTSPLYDDDDDDDENLYFDTTFIYTMFYWNFLEYESFLSRKCVLPVNDFLFLQPLMQTHILFIWLTKMEG